MTEPETCCGFGGTFSIKNADTSAAMLADKVRNIVGQESTWNTADIVKREKLPNSLMPPGLVSNLTVHEFASLLDYLESLSKK